MAHRAVARKQMTENRRQSEKGIGRKNKLSVIRDQCIGQRGKGFEVQGSGFNVQTSEDRKLAADWERIPSLSV